MRRTVGKSVYDGMRKQKGLYRDGVPVVNFPVQMALVRKIRVYIVKVGPLGAHDKINANNNG